MNDKYDDFSDIDFSKINRVTNTEPFSLNQIKITHYYFSFDNVEAGVPVATSIELTKTFNNETNIQEWTRIIEHTYRSFNDALKLENSINTENSKNFDDLLRELNNIELRNLKNNYFTDEGPVNYTSWMIEYNHKFRIVGTYDNELPEFKKIAGLLNLKEVIAQEKAKITVLASDK